MKTIKDTVKLSVVVPVYNTEKYLKKCLNSLVHQTLENIEIIVINDGSTDNSAAICEYYAKEHKQIRFINNTENSGLSYVRNLGIAESLGDYIGFVDSDDYIEINMFEKLYKSIIKNNCDIAICNYIKLTEAGEVLHESKYYKNFNERVIDNNINNLINIVNYGDIMAWNKLYKQHLFNDIQYPVKKTFEDVQTTCKLIEKAEKIVYINDPLYYYISREDSITTTRSINNHMNYISSLKNQYDYLKHINPILKTLAQNNFLSNLINLLRIYGDINKYPDEKNIIKGFLGEIEVSSNIPKKDWELLKTVEY